MLDDREPILMGDRAYAARATLRLRRAQDWRLAGRRSGVGSGFSAVALTASSSSRSLSLPVIESLNSRMPRPERAPEIGQALRAEDHEHDDEHDDDL